MPHIAHVQKAGRKTRREKLGATQGPDIAIRRMMDSAKTSKKHMTPGHPGIPVAPTWTVDCNLPNVVECPADVNDTKMMHARVRGKICVKSSRHDIRGLPCTRLGSVFAGGCSIFVNCLERISSYIYMTVAESSFSHAHIALRIS
jgi:hypothetical protein